MRQPENREVEVYTGERRRGAWLACGLLSAGLLATALTVLLVKAHVEAATKVEFDFTCNKIRGRILSRLSAHEQILLSAAAFFEGTEGVTRQQWRRFVERQELGSRLAGTQGLGFARLIPRRRLAQHIQDIRAEGFPAYQVRPAGEREPYSAIVYLEPFKGLNLRAFGYDMLSEPVRREAMERACDRNAPALSAKVILVQETGTEVQAGTLMYMPVYRKGLPIDTVARRRAAIEGWVYSPYRMADLLRGILGGWDLANGSRICLEVYDGERAAPETLLYDSHPAGEQQPVNVLQSRITAAGREWTLRFATIGNRELRQGVAGGVRRDGYQPAAGLAVFKPALHPYKGTAAQGQQRGIQFPVRQHRRRCIDLRRIRADTGSQPYRQRGIGLHSSRTVRSHYRPGEFAGECRADARADSQGDGAGQVLL